jgi:hypothetical protein
MIVTGVILALIGLFFNLQIFVTIGIILVVVGAILTILGGMGRTIGGRRTWY